MTLPAAIQQQLDAADAIDAAIRQQHEADEQSGDAGIQVEFVDAGTPDGQNSPTATAAPSPAPAAPQGDASLWEQRYRTLQGKYDADVPRLHSDLKEMRGQLKTAMDILQARAQAPAEPAADPKKPLVTQQDVDTFGADLVDLVARKAKEIAGEESAALRTYIQTLEGKLGQTAQRQELSDDDRFYLHLSHSVPDYKEVNADQRWLVWLGVKDPLTGSTRQDYLNAACAGRDVARTAAIFKAFKDTLDQPTAPATTPQQELQRQVAPARSRASNSPSAPQASKVWNSKDINAFYTKVRMGEVKGDEAARIEADINAAMAEGRIRP